MQVQEIMTRDVKFCRPETDLAAATGILWSSNCGALPILDKSDNIIGIITDRDICMAVGTRNQVPSSIRVSQVKPNPQQVYTCSPQDDIQTALNTMRKYGVRRLPVVGNGSKSSLHGILSLDDVALQATEKGPVSYHDVAETLKEISKLRVPIQAAA